MPNRKKCPPLRQQADHVLPADFSFCGTFGWYPPRSRWGKWDVTNARKLDRMASHVAEEKQAQFRELLAEHARKPRNEDREVCRQNPNVQCFCRNPYACASNAIPGFFGPLSSGDVAHFKSLKTKEDVFAYLRQLPKIDMSSEELEPAICPYYDGWDTTLHELKWDVDGMRSFNARVQESLQMCPNVSDSDRVDMLKDIRDDQRVEPLMPYQPICRHNWLFVPMTRIVYQIKSPESFLSALRHVGGSLLNKLDYTMVSMQRRRGKQERCTPKESGAYRFRFDDLSEPSFEILSRWAVIHAEQEQEEMAIACMWAALERFPRLRLLARHYIEAIVRLCQIRVASGEIIYADRQRPKPELPQPTRVCTFYEAVPEIIYTMKHLAQPSFVSLPPAKGPSYGGDPSRYPFGLLHWGVMEPIGYSFQITSPLWISAWKKVHGPAKETKSDADMKAP